MTQQEIVKEFSNYSAVEQAALISRLAQVMQRKLEQKNGVEDAERIAAIDRLKGIAAVEGKPAPTDEEIKEDYVNYLTEKYS